MSFTSIRLTIHSHISISFCGGRWRDKVDWFCWIGSVKNQHIYQHSLCSSHFAGEALKPGICITGYLRQQNTSFHIWPIIQDVKECLCLLKHLKHRSSKHIPDWSKYVYFPKVINKKQSNNWIKRGIAIGMAMSSERVHSALQCT